MSPRLETDLFVAHVEALVDADALSVGEPRLEPLPAVAADRGDGGVSEVLTSTDTPVHDCTHYGPLWTMPHRKHNADPNCQRRSEHAETDGWRIRSIIFETWFMQT